MACRHLTSKIGWGSFSFLPDPSRARTGDDGSRARGPGKVLPTRRSTFPGVRARAEQFLPATP